MNESTHGRDQTSDFWSPDFFHFSWKVFRVTGTPFTHVKNCFQFWGIRDNVFDIYGDPFENLFQILAVVITLSLISSVRGMPHVDSLLHLCGFVIALMNESWTLVGKTPFWMMHVRHCHDKTIISVLLPSLCKTNDGHHLIMAMEPYMYMYIYKYMYIYISVYGYEFVYVSLYLWVYSSHKILASILCEHPMK